jgi:hypothetical protein
MEAIIPHPNQCEKNFSADDALFNKTYGPRINSYYSMYSVTPLITGPIGIILGVLILVVLIRSK